MRMSERRNLCMTRTFLYVSHEMFLSDYVYFKRFVFFEVVMASKQKLSLLVLEGASLLFRGQIVLVQSLYLFPPCVTTFPFNNVITLVSLLIQYRYQIYLSIVRWTM